MSKKITVITTVYNDGHYLSDVMDCLADQTTEDFDWLIIDDNSTDPATLDLLAQIAENIPDTQVIKQNPALKGVGHADRAALEQATGDYILLLESDDRIAPFYLEEAARILDENPEVGVVYGKAVMFGPASVVAKKLGLELNSSIRPEQPVEVEWQLPAYSYPEIITGNRVFMSAMYRRADYLETLGYSGELNGFQDYDLWLSFTELALKRGLDPNKFFYQIPEVVYYYRQRESSLTSTYKENYAVKAHSFIYRRHQELFNNNIQLIFEQLNPPQG